MRTLLVAVVLLLVAIAVVGYFRGWFQFSTGNPDHSTENKPSVMVTVDPGKIKADENKVKEAVQGFGRKAKETPGARTETVR